MTTFETDVLTPMDELGTYLIAELKRQILEYIRTTGSSPATAYESIVAQATTLLSDTCTAIETDIVFDESFQHQIRKATLEYQESVAFPAQETYYALVTVATDDPYERIDPELHDAYTVYEQQGPITILATMVYALNMHDALSQLIEATSTKLIIIVEPDSDLGRKVADRLQEVACNS